MGDAIDPAQHPGEVAERAERALGGVIGPHRAHALDPQRGEIAAGVDPQPALEHVVAALHGAEELLAAPGTPLHRAGELPRCPQDGDVFRIGEVARAEPAADIVRDHAQRAVRDAQARREVVAQLVHALAAEPDFVAPGSRIMGRERRAGLQEAARDAVVDHLERDDGMGPGQAGLRRFRIASFPIKTEV